jgi:hypothetical protein
MPITLLLHIALAVPATGAVSTPVVHAALVETARIWAPYGVVVDAAPAGSARREPCDSDGDDTILTVALVETRRSAVPPGWRVALGAITFSADGAPAPLITVFVTDIERFVAGARFGGARPGEWPRRLRDDVLGRALGRVLAHEIGHYVLRSPRHASGGLMAALQLADDLAALSPHRFMLTAPDRARLEEVR